jgi:ArsR family transcriptional regulator
MARGTAQPHDNAGHRFPEKQHAIPTISRIAPQKGMKVQPFHPPQGNDALADDGAAIAADMQQQSEKAAAFLKALAHEGRLLILCHLNTGEKSVTELERLLGQRQAAVSQQLARLRMEGLVRSRREGKAIHYSIGDPRAARMIALLYEIFCADEGIAK